MNCKPCRTLGVAVATLTMGFLGPAVLAKGKVPTAEDCAALANVNLSIADDAAAGDGRFDQGAVLAKRIRPAVTATTLVPAAGAVPEYCRVEGPFPPGTRTKASTRCGSQ